MLVRVAGSIERFPCHTVPILTTAVVECALAGAGRDGVRLRCVAHAPGAPGADQPHVPAEGGGHRAASRVVRRSLLCGSDAPPQGLKSSLHDPKKPRAPGSATPQVLC